MEKFYKKVLEDPLVKDFFKGVNMEQQKAKQRKFMTVAFGGPNEYSGKDMKSAHAHLKLTNVHFDTIVKLLGETLSELGVAADLIQEAATIVETTRKDIVILYSERNWWLSSPREG